MIILAGGAGKRLGKPKALYEWQGRPWILHQLEACARLGIPQVIVVLGHEADRVQAIVSQSQVSYKTVTNPNPDLGPFSSLQCGLSVIQSATGSFVIPVDVPVPDSTTWSLLQKSAAQHPDSSAVVPVYNTQPGHPVYLSPAFIQKILDLDPRDPESRLDVQIQKLLVKDKVQLPVQNSKILLNLNTPEDWATLTV